MAMLVSRSNRARGADRSYSPAVLEFLMDRQTRVRIGNIVWPLFAGLSFVTKAIDRTFLAWWLWPLLQRKANATLWQDLRRDLPFLCREGQFVEEKRSAKVLPFDYAETYVRAGNLLFCFSRGRGEINVSVAPSHAPRDSYQLAIVIAALDCKGIVEITMPTELADLNGLIQSRFDGINDAFSEAQFLEFKKRVSEVKENVRVLTRQAEWELNRRLSSLRTRGK
jgi:hypothetical protein